MGQQFMKSVRGSRWISTKKTDLFMSGGNYAQFRPTYPPTLFHEIAQYANQSPNRSTKSTSQAVDVGSGTGQATVELARYYDVVIGVEGSQSQRNHAIQAPKVRYVDGTAEALPIESNSTDLVTVAQALHWFDLSKFYVEVNRVLKSGGTLAIWSYGMAILKDETANRVLQDFHFKFLGPYWDAKRALVDNGYKDIDLPSNYLRQQRLSRLMGKEVNLVELLNYIGTWSALKTFSQKHPEKADPRLQLKSDLERAYAEWRASPEHKMALTHPIVLLLAQKP